MKKKWQCEICYADFPTKKELIDDLRGHLEEAMQDSDTAQGQLRELGVKDLGISW